MLSQANFISIGFNQLLVENLHAHSALVKSLVIKGYSEKEVGLVIIMCSVIQGLVENLRHQFYLPQKNNVTKRRFHLKLNLVLTGIIIKKVRCTYKSCLVGLLTCNVGSRFLKVTSPVASDSVQQMSHPVCSHNINCLVGLLTCNVDQ